MKTSRILFTLLFLAGISTFLPPANARAHSRVYVGFDLGGVIGAFDSGPRYVYSPPVVYERRPAWRPAPPPPYPPPRWYRHYPPPPRFYGPSHYRSHHRYHDCYDERAPRYRR
ncbi:MAG: hypothetical protein AB7E77_04275 [Desulfobulbus sp.]